MLILATSRVRDAIGLPVECPLFCAKLPAGVDVKRTSTIAAVYVVGKAAPSATRSTEVCDAAMARNIRKAAQAAP